MAWLIKAFRGKQTFDFVQINLQPFFPAWATFNMEYALWRFQTHASPWDFPGKILVNCAYCLPRKLGCDLAALPYVSPAWITWQL